MRRVHPTSIPLPFLLLLLVQMIQIQCSLDASASSDTMSRTNWNLSFETFPARILQPHSVEDILSCVSSSNQNQHDCPSPILAVASMHSVTSCVVVDGGTLIDMSAMNQITHYNASTGIVTCEAGVKMADLHDRLLEDYDREISFSPEIGDATVGSLAVATSKDSSVNGPGYFAALVTSIQYVNAQGHLIQLDRHKSPQEEVKLETFLCTFGMKGIVVQVDIQTRPAQKILTRMAATQNVANADDAYQLVATARQNGDNAYFLLSPHEGIMVTLERYAINDNNPQQQQQLRPHQGLVARLLNPILIQIIQHIAFYTIQHGVSFSDASWRLSRRSNLGLFDTIAKQFFYHISPVDIVHYRRDFVNRYHRVTSRREKRLDFSLFIYDLSSSSEDAANAELEVIFKDTYNFAVNWYQTTGFGPNGFNMYFCHRTGKKPYGEFSGPPGLSFAMDPYYSNPDSIEWKRFVQALNARNRERFGVYLSPTQSRFLQPHDFSFWTTNFHNNNKWSNSNSTVSSLSEVRKSLVDDRFLTPFYQHFII